MVDGSGGGSLKYIPGRTAAPCLPHPLPCCCHPALHCAPAPLRCPSAPAPSGLARRVPGHHHPAGLPDQEEPGQGPARLEAPLLCAGQHRHDVLLQPQGVRMCFWRGRQGTHGDTRWHDYPLLQCCLVQAFICTLHLLLQQRLPTACTTPT